MKYANEPKRGMLIRGHWRKKPSLIICDTEHCGYTYNESGDDRILCGNLHKDDEIRWPHEPDTAWRRVFEKEPKERRDAGTYYFLRGTGEVCRVSPGDVTGPTVGVIWTIRDGIIADVRLATQPAEPSGNAEQLAGMNPPNVRRETRYDWSNVNKEHGWIATDKGGAIWSFREKPIRDAGGWLPRGECQERDWTCLSDYDEECPNWRESLEARPVSP